MTYKIGKKTLEEVVLQSARNSGFSKKRLKAIEELCLPQVKKYSAKDIKAVRSKLNLSQDIFALVLGVSDKTVKGWEQGNNISKLACRLLAIIEKQGISAIANN